MSDKEGKVIGFIAQRKGTIDLLCDGDSAVVAGSEKRMKTYLSDSLGRSDADYEIKKARYGNILQCLKLGAAYSFNEEAYGRFYRLAIQEGMKLVEFGQDASQATGKTGLHLLQVKWI